MLHKEKQLSKTPDEYQEGVAWLMHPRRAVPAAKMNLVRFRRGSVERTMTGKLEVVGVLFEGVLGNERSSRLNC